MEGFKHATSLDLNLGYYHIKLPPDASKVCTIVLSWSKYEYCKLSIGLCSSSDIFQEKMNELFAGFKEVMAYIDHLLLITKGTYEEQLEKVDKV